MSDKEIKRGQVLEAVLKHQKRQAEAAEELGISERQIRRLIRRYREEGISGIVSKRRGKPSNRRLEERTREKVIKYIRDPMTKGFGPSFLAEKLRENRGIKLSKETVRHLMMELGLWKAKGRKVYSHHYSRERREHLGELVQIDGSYHGWLEDRGPKACLLVFAEMLQAPF